MALHGHDEASIPAPVTLSSRQSSGATHRSFSALGFPMGLWPRRENRVVPLYFPPMAKRTRQKQPPPPPAPSSPPDPAKVVRRTPAAPAEPPARSRPSSLVDTRVVWCGDCLEQLANLPDKCVDLVYIDPPFNSNRNYEVFWGETKEKRAFEDRHASTQAYIEYMRPRCVQLARVLKDTGSFYYHCDWHASHYVKVMLDQILGENSFRNEIIWRRTTAKSQTFHSFPNNHDSLFFYVGGEQHTFHRQFKPHSQARIDQHYSNIEEGTGRRYSLDNLTAEGIRNGRSGLPFRGIDIGAKGNHWKFTVDKLDAMDKEGRIYWPKKAGGMPRLKRYLDEQEGVLVDTVWEDIPPINSQAKESLGYPTQKPIALLDRIVKSSSNPNDIVLDAFCGCGTALVAAQNLSRQWIGIDISPTACRVMAKRLRDVCGMKESEPLWKARRADAFVVRDLPWTIEKLKKLPPFEFENWAVIALGGIPNKTQVGDMGIDGRIYPVGSRPQDEAKGTKNKHGVTGETMFMDDWFPVQVKQTDKVGRPDIDQFEAVMAREDRTRGFFVAFGYSADAQREAAAFYKKTGRIIKLISVQEILDEEHVGKM
ncbi:MAG: restriction endonuclease [Phycisphaeraceae bacterium]|nr:restriction endonuclease [Phycisphaeraceae bacterium]MCW5763444.1 restriction endonuclease [Phycisphaeraceae bacterium]